MAASRNGRRTASNATGEHIPGTANPWLRPARIDNGIWGGLFQYQNGRFQRPSGTGIIHPEVLAIHEDRGGQLWVGTRGGLAQWDEHNWTVFTTGDGLATNVVRAIADDREGNLWLGT